MTMYEYIKSERVNAEKISVIFETIYQAGALRKLELNEIQEAVDRYLYTEFDPFHYREHLRDCFNVHPFGKLKSKNELEN